MSMHPSETMSERGTGGAFFAALLMIIGGAMAAFAGIAGIVKDAFYVITPNYWITLSVAAWGWTFLIIGVIVAAAGFGVMSGATWARWLGIGVTSIAALVAFLFIPIAPFLAMTLIALDVWIIHSLVVHKKEPQMIYLNAQAATTSATQPQQHS